MADLGAGAAEEAAKTVGAVTAQAANEGGWAFAVVALIAVSLLLALWIWRSTQPRNRLASDPADPSCPPSGGRCPEIHVLAVEIRHLSDQLKEDGNERREHRTEVREGVERIHARIDDQNKTFATRQELDGLTRVFEHFTEEATQILKSLRQMIKPL